jgi:hypothetical protein
MGLISCLYLFVRFCIGKSIIANLKNLFVIRHFIYIFLYILCHTPIVVNEILVLSGRKPILVKPSFLVHLFMGFIMFLIRASETSFYKILCCRKYENRQNLNQSNSESRVIINLILGRNFFREKSAFNNYYFEKYEFGIYVLYFIWTF